MFTCKFLGQHLDRLSKYKIQNFSPAKRILCICLQIVSYLSAGFIYSTEFDFSDLQADKVDVNVRIEDYFYKIVNKEGLHWMAQIDFIYMINSDQNRLKYERTMNTFRPYGIFPYRFSSIEGHALTFQALDDLGVIYSTESDNACVARVFRHMNNKEFISNEIMKEPDIAYYSFCTERDDIANVLNHLSILQDACDRGYKTIWIMDDDVQVVSSPNQLSRLVSVLNVLSPDWDILFTDRYVKGEDGAPVSCKLIRPRPLLDLQSLSYYQMNHHLNEEITKVGMHYGAHSMIISRSGIIKILDFYKVYKVFFPYDIECCLIPGIKLFACTSDIVTNITGGIHDLGWRSYLEKGKK